MTREEMDQATAHLTTKSAKIRALDKLGAARSEIASYLQIRYQHVRNVLVAPAPSNPSERATRQESDAISQDIRPLTIQEAKLGLAAKFGVSPSAIEITIHG